MGSKINLPGGPREMYGTCFRYVLLEGQVDSSKDIKYCLVDARQALEKRAEAAGNLLIHQWMCVGTGHRSWRIEQLEVIAIRR